MRIVYIFIFLAVSLFAQQDKCYSVQLSSNIANKEGLYHLFVANLPKGCHILKTGKYLTPRCGCFEGYSKAKKLQKKLQIKYKDSIIVLTQKQRYKNEVIEIPKKMKPPKACLSLELLRESKNKPLKPLNKQLQLECKWLNFGLQRALRCGCYDTKKQQLQAFERLKKEYKNLKKTKTYVTRFDTKIKQKKKNLECQVFYNKAQYTKAVECFKQDIKNYNDFDREILWARAEEKRGRINYAIAAYERALEIKPNSSEIASKLLKLYMKNNQKSSAMLLFDDLIQDFFSKKEKKSLYNIIENSKKSDDRKKSYTMVLSTKVGYDTNIASTSDDATNRTRVYGDFFFSNTVSLSYKQYMTNNKNIFVMPRIQVYTNDYLEHTLYNTIYAKIGLDFGYNYKNNLFLFPFSFAYTNYLKQDLLKTYNIGMQYKRKILKKSFVKLNSKYTQKRYLSSKLTSYNTNSYAINLSLNWIEKLYFLEMKLSGGKTKAQNLSTSLIPKYLEQKQYGVLLHGLYKLNAKYSLDLKYDYTISYYDDSLYTQTSSSFLLLSQKREDKLQKIKLKFNKKISKKMKLFSEIVLTDNNSNLSVSDYSKQLLSVGMSYKF